MASLAERIRFALSNRANTNVGYLAEFSDPGALYDAVKAVRKKGYERIDTFSPFPIHGMDRLMGLGQSPLGFMAFGGAMLGLSLSILMQWWMSAVDYPLNVGNKPTFAFEQAMPINFELMVVFAAITIVVGMLALNGLPRPYNPLFFSSRFARVTDDGFFLQVQIGDRKFDRAPTADLLYDLGAASVEFIDHDGAYEVGRDGRAFDAPPTPPGEPPPPHTTGAV
ncbi:DUF3341 domain-containing protein [soil metagenome]